MSFHSCEVLRTGKFIQTESRKVLTPGTEGGRNGELVLWVQKFLLGKMKKFQKWIVMMAVQHCECT